MTTTYEEVLIDGLAQGLELEASILRLFPSLLPTDDTELFPLFNLLPGSGMTLDPQGNRFSDTYKSLLDAQPPRMSKTLAEKNFEKSSYWLTKPPGQGIPLFTPTSENLKQQVGTGGPVTISFGSSTARDLVQASLPSFPHLKVKSHGLEVEGRTTRKTVSFQLHLDHVANFNLRFGAWFNQALFTSSYQNKKWETGPHKPTWDDIFGPDGTLTYVTTGVIAGAGMILKITVNGIVHEDSTGDPPIWPFVKPGPKCEFTAEDTLEIRIKTPATEYLLLALRAQTTKSLLGG